MFVIRQAKLEDAPSLLKLAKMVHFINLPADPNIIHEKIVRARTSFRGKAKSADERQFMFVMEDLATGNVVGTSAVISANSWEGHPHTFFKVRRREFYSTDLNTGSVHTTLQLGIDETGTSEIGGLILSPAYRGHSEKLGGTLSMIRFHYVGLHREWFSQRMIAEMMAPLTPDSRNSLWEYLGRRFINLKYAEADAFCQHSKEFITSLLPKEEIYVSLLPPEARNLIGKVGPETEPAKRMLERMGFQYLGDVDPFDGGPYLEADLDDVELCGGTSRTKLVERSKHKLDTTGFVSFEGPSGFRAVRTQFTEVDGGIAIDAEHAEAIHAEVGDTVGYVALPKRQPRAVAATERKPSPVETSTP